jgi:hypothetical protein
MLKFALKNSCIQDHSINIKSFKDKHMLDSSVIRLFVILLQKNVQAGNSVIFKS